MNTFVLRCNDPRTGREPAVSAQMTAQIQGVATDPSGATIPGVQITLINSDTRTKSSAISNDSGYYTAPLLQPGTYIITAEKPGFRPMTRSGIKLEVAQTARIDLSMDLGSVTQSVDVKETADALDTGTSSIGQVVDSTKIANLPTNGRNANAFVALVPGVRAPRGVSQPATAVFSRMRQSSSLGVMKDELPHDSPYSYSRAASTLGKPRLCAVNRENHRHNH